MTEYSKYEIMAGKVDEAATFQRLTEHLKYASEASYIIGHIRKWNGDEPIGDGFLAIGQMLELMVGQVTKLANRRLN